MALPKPTLAIARNLLLDRPPEGFQPTNCLFLAIDKARGGMPRLIQMWLRPEDMDAPDKKEVWVYVPCVQVT